MQALTSNLGGSAQDQTASFAYNPAGQIDSLSKSNDAFAWGSHYNRDTVSAANGLNQLTTATPGSGQTSVPALAYDARGNLSGIGSTSYAYTSENRLTLAQPAGAATGLRYDLGGRLWQLTKGANVTRFDYSGSALLAELDGTTGTILRRYVHGAGVDEPIVQYEGSTLATKRFLTADERGSIVAVTDSSGNATAINRYDEYGQPQSSNAAISSGGRFQYTGQTWLPELGMYYYKARIYNPALGRFMQTDPIGYGDGMNWYAYVDSDPVNGVDPSGLTGEIFGPQCTSEEFIRFNIRSDGSRDYLPDSVHFHTTCTGIGMGNGTETFSGHGAQPAPSENSSGGDEIVVTADRRRTYRDIETIRLRSIDPISMWLHYADGTGTTVCLTRSQFASVANGARVAGAAVRINSNLFSVPVSFYNFRTPGLAFSRGRSTLYLNSQGIPVGLYDDGNYDSKPWGVRPDIAEAVTRAGNRAAPNGENYDVVHPCS